MYTTGSGLSENTRAEIIELCNARLADAVDLQLQCKYAHWNVKGPHFLALHKFFNQVSEDVGDYLDLIAERTVQLGGIADCTTRIIPTWAHLEDFKAQKAVERDFIRTLAAALASFGKVAREAIEKSNKCGDAVSANIFTEISRGTDEWLWMMESQLQAE